MRTRGKGEGAPFSSVAPQSASSSPGLLADETLMSGITDYVALNLPVLPLTQVSRALGHNVYPRAGDWVEIKTLGRSPIVKGAVSGVTGTIGTRIYATDSPNTPDDGAAVVEVSPSPDGLAGPSVTFATTDAANSFTGSNLTADIVGVSGPFIDLHATGSGAGAGLVATGANATGEVAAFGSDPGVVIQAVDTGGSTFQTSAVLSAESVTPGINAKTQVIAQSSTPGIDGSLQIIDNQVLLAAVGAGGTLTLGGESVTINGTSSLSFSGATVAVTGSRGGNAALASLITALATIGLISDGTSP